MSTKTRVILMNSVDVLGDGLTHLVEVRLVQRVPAGVLYWTQAWCEDRPFEWSSPAFQRAPATCMWCNAATRPTLAPWKAGDAVG